MNPAVVLPALTSILALVFAVALFDQWRERRGGFQLIWTIGMIFYGVGAGCEALAAAGSWNEALYRTWYLTGAVWTAGWLGLGTAYLLGKTRFGYSFALCLFLAGLFTFLVRNKPEYAGAGTLPLLYFIAAGLLALAVAVETYFANDRWPILAAAAVVGATVLSVVLMATTTLPAPGYAVDPATGAPVATLFPPQLRLLTPFLNITGAFALILGAVFSTYVFMPKRRVLAYSLDPDQPGDEFLFNLLIAPVAIIVNLVASLPGTVQALFAGRLHSRVPATHPDRDRCLRGDAGRHAQPVRDDRVVPAREVPRGAVPVRRLPRLDRGLPRDPDPVHVDPTGSHPSRTGRRRGTGRLPPTRPRAPTRPTSITACGGPPEASGGPRAPSSQPTSPYHVATPVAGIGPTMSPCLPTDRPPVAGFVVVIVAASLFGTLGPLSRFAYDAGMEPLPFVVWRGLIGLAGAAVFVAWRIRRGNMRLTRLSDLDRGAKVSLAVAALMGFTLNLAMFISFDLVTVALALLGFYTYPVIVAVVNVALGRETLDRPRIIALALAIAGMVAVVASAARSVGWDPLRRDRVRAGAGRGTQPGRLRGHQQDRLPEGPGRTGDGRDPGHDGRVRVRADHPDRRRCGARLPAAGPLGPAAARLHRAVRGGHPVDPVPDRDPADRRDPSRDPDAVRAGRRRRAGRPPARRDGSPRSRSQADWPSSVPR